MSSGVAVAPATAKTNEVVSPYCPKQGDVVWVILPPLPGQRQGGNGLAVALSPESYNKKSGLVIVCPVTTQTKGYPFEVAVPAGIGISGVILADQVRSISWKEKRTRFCCKLPYPTSLDIFNRLGVLLNQQPVFHAPIKHLL